ncbi:MAG: D-alanyl-D-alanine carboxypeptidase/D-alanyl-D-alanine-endopeptidase [Tildeniella nuda ZEHNDER 1965/U140]|jgi:D-alanyl-D-alanine carboxypeptidase/D-alanyl-D-alanine-endopeptidase (penicillin-binding protein 4)|nr:D-alanyl-D-alanine carboxypeptidase/D-alanyl-D-alanine-endopeptidase [Tildeniella nuda ZEHNDER 1965/U140]
MNVALDYLKRALAALLPTAGVLIAIGSASAAQPLAQPNPRSSVLAQAGATDAVCPAQLGGAIDRITKRTSLAGVRWSILVQTLGASNKTLFASNATTLLIPASNNKLLTTAAALKALGAQYRFRTTVYGDRSQPNLTTLRIVGNGDPSLTTSQLVTLAQQLSQKGVQQVEQLIGDDTYFRGAATNPYWDASDTLQGYGAPVNSLMLNQNGIGLTLFPQRVGQPLRVQWDDPTDANSWRISNQSVTVSASGSEYVDAVRGTNQRLIQVSGQLRVGSEAEPIAVSIPNPGNYLIDKFRTALTNASITIQRSTVVKTTPAPLGQLELAAIESAPLAQLLIETNRESNNTYAEALLKTLGVTRFPGSQDATVSGIAAVKAALTPLGVNPAGYSMVDGSGLANRDRASAAALVQTLQAMAQAPDAKVYRNSLAISGINGTLKNRFRNTAAQGKLQGKTGTISGVVALSGYLTPPNHPDVVLSLLTNYSGASTTTVRGAVDEIVLVLTRLRSC